MGIGNITNSGLNSTGKVNSNETKKTESKKEEVRAQQAFDKKEVTANVDNINIKAEAIGFALNNPIENDDEAMQSLQEAIVAMLGNKDEAVKSQVNLNSEQVLKVLEA